LNEIIKIQICRLRHYCTMLFDVYYLILTTLSATSL
jgi:hypothetical protein